MDANNNWVGGYQQPRPIQLSLVAKQYASSGFWRPWNNAISGNQINNIRVNQEYIPPGDRRNDIESNQDQVLEGPVDNNQGHIVVEIEDGEDIVEGRTSFNLKEHLFNLRYLFTGHCPPCILKIVINYQLTSQYSFAEICTEDHLRRLITFFVLTTDVCFLHKHKHGRMLGRTRRAQNATDFFAEI